MNADAENLSRMI